VAALVREGFVMADADLIATAVALHRSGKLDEAHAMYRAMIQANRLDAAAWNNLGNVLKDSGRIEEAVQCCREALRIEPGNAQIHSSLCYKLHFHPDFHRADLFGELTAWNDAHAARTAAAFSARAHDRDPGRRLRIGYVSPDFYGQAECFFVLPLLRKHDREKFEVHCYASVRTSDAATELLKSCADVWHDVLMLSDEELAGKVRDDQIDILVDLTMHMAFNRLLTFARKPAPIQVAWLAYPGGTGLSAIDYRLTDAYLDPVADMDAGYAEKSVRLPHCWICYDPLGDVSPAAASERSHVVFGCLNNPAKLNVATLNLWAKVLQNTKDSRLLLLVHSAEQRRRIVELFSAVSINSERIEFASGGSRRHYLRLYDRIDICLDPQPYNGITTTCDALWMGVPTLALWGRTAAGRAAGGILSEVGHPEWARDDGGDFVEIATALASNREALREWRAALRAEFLASPVANSGQFARDVEAAYRGMWIK
jgi:predicted O-linked N-acetylglucosamine transferase (SPINDLY family)